MIIGIIGRKREQELLEDAYYAKKAQFITVYGRLRVGKTFLVREFFSKKDCLFFHATGRRSMRMSGQLQAFMKALSETFYRGIELKVPLSWDDAFRALHAEIKGVDGKVVIFLDELPWMASPKSSFMDALDEYWNKYWVAMPNVIVVVCGSSASWMIKRIINDRGGFHGRSTLKIRLMPFDLSETRDYLRSEGVTLNDKHILSLYMALGGIPYYLDFVNARLTSQQNIQRLFFDEGSPLKDEYNLLFDSLFNRAAPYKEIMQVISRKKDGIARAELKRMVKLSTGGGYLTKRLDDLCNAGFIEEFIPWGKAKGEHYKIIDEFCLFYLQWVAPYKNDTFDEDHWVLYSKRPEYLVWAGYAFEAVCRKHIHKIIREIGIKAATPMSSWRYVPKVNEEGAQVDMVVERFDNAITLIEVKYNERPFVVDKRYAAVLERKVRVFKERTKTKKEIFIAMVAASGLKRSVYSEEMVSAVVTLEDLF